ncbi:hypothetical protein V1514DRAFT_339983, partial [Lipomyces japonicus]|uniref:uncharacterized protein n=1 Tax=Lipomyces japonicus TaxID=56871 RepID=UPI0034CFC19F
MTQFIYIPDLPGNGQSKVESEAVKAKHRWVATFAKKNSTSLHLRASLGKIFHKKAKPEPVTTSCADISINTMFACELLKLKIVDRKAKAKRQIPDVRFVNFEPGKNEEQGISKRHWAQHLRIKMPGGLKINLTEVVNTPGMSDVTGETVNTFVTDELLKLMVVKHARIIADVRSVDFEPSFDDSAWKATAKLLSNDESGLSECNRAFYEFDESTDNASLRSTKSDQLVAEHDRIEIVAFWQFHNYKARKKINN